MLIGPTGGISNRFVKGGSPRPTPSVAFLICSMLLTNDRSESAPRVACSICFAAPSESDRNESIALLTCSIVRENTVLGDRSQHIFHTIQGWLYVRQKM